MIFMAGQIVVLILEIMIIQKKPCISVHIILLVASAKAVKIGKEINPDFLIGNMISMVPFYPYSCSPKDQLLAQQLMHDRFFFS